MLKNMPPKTILMACTHHYGSDRKVGSHYLADAFIKNKWRVIFVSAPITPLHVAVMTDEDVKKRIKGVFQKNYQTYGALTDVILFSLIAPDGRPVLNRRIITQNWHKTLFPSPMRILRKLGIHYVDLLYIDNIFQKFWLDTIPHGTRLFRVMDPHDTFPGWQGKTYHIARSIAQKSHITIYSADSLKAYVGSLHPKRSKFIPNGVDFNMFQNSQKTKWNHLIKPSNQYNALYVGAIDHRVDLALLRRVSSRLMHVNFILAGPLDASFHPESFSKNVMFTGPIPHASLPALFKKVDLGIIPFDTKNQYHRISGIRPLKLLEYLAAGLPVVCARWPEVEKMECPVFFYEDEHQFIDAVMRALKGPVFPDKYKAYAKRHDWSISFQMLMDTIGDHHKAHGIE